MERLPEEIKEMIIALSEPYFCYVLGREPDEKMLFLEGGIMIILGQVLKRGADIKTLMFMKKFIPADLAIWKAIHCTMDPKIITRVCLIWNSWESSGGYEESANKRFIWGINHIECKERGNPWFMNKIYYKMGMIDKLDLTIEEPLGMVSLKDAVAYLTPDDLYLKFTECDVDRKVLYFAHKGDVSKLEELLEEKLDEEYKIRRELNESSRRERGRGRGRGRARETSISLLDLGPEWNPHFLTSIVWALAVCHGDIKKALYIGEKYKKHTTADDSDYYSSLNIIVRLHAFDGLDHIEMTEKGRDICKAVFNVDGCDRSLIEDPDNKSTILFILNEISMYNDRIYHAEINSEFQDYEQDRIGFEGLNHLHSILQDDYRPRACDCFGRKVTEKEYIDMSNKCYDYNHIAYNWGCIGFDKYNRRVYYPNEMCGDSIEEAQCIVAHIMRFGDEIKNIDVGIIYNNTYGVANPDVVADPGVVTDLDVVAEWQTLWP
ncbi:hypothetical protein BJ944DRAFT_265482 [Cunninghamella echinulata]|nr:hypothetical protein BJ944DRAFT_265482 [Cunninghamella echinulata]